MQMGKQGQRFLIGSVIMTSRSQASGVKRRELDDEELDSGDDENRRDRLQDDEGYAQDEEDMEAHSQNVVDIRVARHPIPNPSDGEVSASWCSRSTLGRTVDPRISSTSSNSPSKLALSPSHSITAPFNHQPPTTTPTTHPHPPSPLTKLPSTQCDGAIHQAIPQISNPTPASSVGKTAP